MPDTIYEYFEMPLPTHSLPRIEYINEKALDGWRVASTHLDISTGVPTVMVLFERPKKVNA